MKKNRQPIRTSAILFLTASLLILSAGMVLAGDEQEPAMSDAAMAEMAAWAKLAEPGEHHEHLGRYVGHWNGTIKMWMEPGAEPMVNTTTASVKMILGGRFLKWHHKGEFDGQPFEGMGIDGYDNGGGEYQSTWQDNFGTLIIYTTGHCSDDGKMRESSGSFDNPMSGGKIKMRTTLEWKDDDHFTYSSYMDYGEGEAKNMEIQFGRAPKE